MLNVQLIKKDFPIFSKTEGNSLVYLDNASTTQKPDQVLDAINDYYRSYSANIHRALYTIGEKATEQYENVREKVRRFLNVPDTYSIIFTRSTTESINLLSYAWARHELKEGDEILVTEMEHHSNLIPWQMAAKDTGATLKYIPITRNGTLDLSELDDLLNPHTKLVGMVHQSNVFGTVNPIEEIITKAKSVGALTVVDGAQSVPHIPINLKELKPDFFAFSGHKMLGPTGVGVLVGRTSILESMEPFMGGGEMIEVVTMDKSTWNKVPWKFEAGTPNIAQVIGLGAAIDYLDSIGMKIIHEHEQELTAYALEALSSIQNLILFGNPVQRGAVIPFNVGNIHPHDLSKFLDMDGICIRAGHHCAQPIMHKLKLTSTARASFYLYNDKSEIDLLCEGIEKTARIFA